jgi:hypothetical protein
MVEEEFGLFKIAARYMIEAKYPDAGKIPLSIKY